jgi:hypothetical protein
VNSSEQNLSAIGPRALLATFFVISTTAIALSPGTLLYDEGFYFKYVSDLALKGLNITYISELSGPTGPLYAIVHMALSWVTSLQVVPMRLASNVLFVLSGIVVGFVLAISSSRNAANAPSLAYAIPFAGVTFGLALTEVPAMLAAALGTLAVVAAVVLVEMPRVDSRQRPQISPTSPAVYTLLVLSGVLFAAAVWGRQNYLAMVIALPLLFISGRSFAWLPWLVVTAVFVALSGLLFWIWGGLVPEPTRFVSDNSVAPTDVLNIGVSPPGVVFGLNIAFGILSLGYASAMFAVLAPGVFIVRLGVLSFSAVAAVIASLLLPQLRFLPSYDALAPRLGPDLITVATMFFGACLAFFGFWLLSSVALRCAERCRGESMLSSGANQGLVARKTWGSMLQLPMSLSISARLYLFASLAWLGILASNMKVGHQFSSRYVVVAAPFLLITAAHHFKWSPWSVARLVVGFSASMAFLTKKYGWWG